MTDFAEMLKAQHALQVESFGKDPLLLVGDERAEFIRWNVLALEDELHEMLGELGWKPWATDRSVNVQPARKELVDAIHFFMNLLLAIHGDEEGNGLTDTPEDIAKIFYTEYFEKKKVNAQRQAEGYTGLDKCPTCKRDRKTTSTLTGTPGENIEYCPCGYSYGVVTDA